MLRRLLASVAVPFALTAGVGSIKLLSTAYNRLREIQYPWQKDEVAERLGIQVPKRYAGGFEPKMTKKEALSILGLKGFPSTEEIEKAYINLVASNHPDRGGSDYLSAKIHEARNLLSKA